MSTEAISSECHFQDDLSKASYDALEVHDCRIGRTGPTTTGAIHTYVYSVVRISSLRSRDNSTTVKVPTMDAWRTRGSSTGDRRGRWGFRVGSRFYNSPHTVRTSCTF